MDFSQVLQRLNPFADPSPIWGIFLYIIAILAIVTLVLQKNPSTTLSILLSIVIMSALIDKVATGMIPEFSPQGFTIFVLRTGMFAIPLLVAGMTRTGKSRMPAIICGLLGGTYLFLRWFFDMRV